MRKLVYLLLFVATAILSVGCGKSECKKYRSKFCTDENSAVCKEAAQRSKDWSADKCRIEFNQIQIEEQAKRLEDELK
jgi:hypothetical protein